MSIEKLVQNFADSTGVIIDHTLNPPRVLGQAFLVSKSKLVTCAGSIFNYTETPWALSVNFPHPGIALGVKSLQLHPDFDRKEARMNYLSQNAVTKYSYPVQVNDLATLIISGDVKQPTPEEIMQLHKVLSLPFTKDGVEVSGALKQNEILEVVKKLLSSNRQGLLTLYDELNIPLAYIQLSGSTISHVYFQGIVGEMAFAELIFRQPAKGFAFQPNYNFAWGEVKKIEMSAADLVAESLRRMQELPAFFNHLGGAGAIYQRVVQEFNVDSFNSNIQWLVNNLWHTIDGYMSVINLSERVGADTYTVVQGLRELSNRGVISLINKSSPFHSNGQLGTPIISHTDFDINPGDALKAFYLDPLSGGPWWQDGVFGGVASVLQPKNLLHSIPINLRVPGALILKNYKLIGVHNGAVQLKPGQSIDRQLYQMMWIGALFDMASKKLRTSETGEEEENTITGSKLSTLRVRGEEEVSSVTKPIVEKLSKYICPNCFATNTQLGNCFNCGSVIDNAPVEEKPHGYFIDKMPVKALGDLQVKYKISDRNMFIGIACAGFLLFSLLMSMLNSCHGNPSGNTTASNTNVEPKNSPQAAHLATTVVGFKGTPPTGYVFEDTSATTNPLPSFGIRSEGSNQKVLFVIFNDMSPVASLDRFIQIPPFSDVTATTFNNQHMAKITEGSQILGDDNFHYYVHSYPLSETASKAIMVGSFPAKEPGKSVLVIGQALKDAGKPGTYDYKSTLFLVDTMAEPLTVRGNQRRLKTGAGGQSTDNLDDVGNAENGNAKFATDEDLDTYYASLGQALKKKTDQSSDLKEAKKTEDKFKIVLEVDIAENGELRKIDIKEPDKEQKYNDAFVRIVREAAPYKKIPKTESGILNLKITLTKGGVKVEES